MLGFEVCTGAHVQHYPVDPLHRMAKGTIQKPERPNRRKIPVRSYTRWTGIERTQFQLIDMKTVGVYRPTGELMYMLVWEGLQPNSADWNEFQGEDSEREFLLCFIGLSSKMWEECFVWWDDIATRGDDTDPEVRNQS